MPIMRAIVTIPYTSGKPEDVSSNTLHFEVAGNKETAAVGIQTLVNELFNVTPPNGPSGNASFPIASKYSNACSRVVNACTTKVYDLADPKPRTPVVKTWTLGTGDSTLLELPAEVALAATIRGAQNVPRQRGRIYFGPFNLSATEDDTVGQRSRPALLLREAIFEAVRRMARNTTAGADLVVLSRGKYQSNNVPQPEVPATSVPVVAGWVDDSWDTQRRRGQDASSRLNWTDVV